MSRLRLMSNNQWNNTPNRPAWEEQGLDCSAEARMKHFAKIFGELLPDVVGGQEINKDMQPLLMLSCREAGLPYTMLWGHFTPIFYRADKLELLDTEYVLYPKQIEGFAGGFNDAKSKSLHVAIFRTKEDGKIFLFATTHLWWRSSIPDSKYYQEGSDEARTYQMKLATEVIAKHRAKYGNCPAVLVGDMNAPLTAPAIQYALQEAGYVHAHDAATEYANENRGYNACGPNGPGSEWQDLPYPTAIDHILVKGLPEGAIRRFDRYMTEEYLYLSDHAPVYVDVEL